MIKISKTSAHGTSHPVIARMLVQTSEIIKFGDFDEPIKKDFEKIADEEKGTPT